MSTSPTQRTLALMRKRGYDLVEVVERWNPHVQIRQDLFGVIDVLCVGNDEVVGVQTTSDTHVRDHVRKLETAVVGVKRGDLVEQVPVLRVLRRSRIRVVVHGWRKRKGRWFVQEVDLS